MKLLLWNICGNVYFFIHNLKQRKYNVKDKLPKIYFSLIIVIIMLLNCTIKLHYIVWLLVSLYILLISPTVIWDRWWYFSHIPQHSQVDKYWDILKKFPVEALLTHTNTFSLKFTPTSNLESAVHMVRLCLDCEGKLKHPEETNTGERSQWKGRV